jgi:hypothetical protein
MLTPPATAVLDRTATIAASAKQLLGGLDVAIWAGEIGPQGGGGPPKQLGDACAHNEMRWANFGDSFWYLDAMALKAAHGYSVFCRQDFIGIDYGLMDCRDQTPLPDYYAALLWTTTMGREVLAVDSSAPLLRAYAHCSAAATRDSGGTDSITVLLINLGRDALHIDLSFDTDASAGARHGLEYVVAGVRSPHAGMVPGAINSTLISINGEVMRLHANGSLPSLSSRRVDVSRGYQLSGYQISFLQLKGVGEQLGCLRARTTPQAATMMKVDDETAGVVRGGNVATAECATDLDCALAGSCGDDGRCTCDVGWVTPDGGGTPCSAFDLLPADPKAPGYKNDTWPSWGGHPVLWPKEKGGDDRWHLFTPQFANGCEVDSWIKNSFIIHAVGASPTGPWGHTELRPPTGMPAGSWQQLGGRTQQGARWRTREALSAGPTMRRSDHSRFFWQASR